VLLSNLLSGDPVPMLGDDVTPSMVKFQAASESPVGDFLVTGMAQTDSIATSRSP
jgi:hypothetical protein